MPLNVPDEGENRIVETVVNKRAPEDLVLRLYSNNITPSDSDTAATYTECAFPGYAPITLLGSSWGVASAGTTVNTQRTFTRSSTGAPESVYGYYLTQATSGTLMWSEKNSAGPVAVANAGDLVRVTPNLSAS